MNNEIAIFNVLKQMKYIRKKVFKGHMVSNIFFEIFFFLSCICLSITIIFVYSYDI